MAVRLPNATPENQVLSISTIIDVVGMVDDRTTMSWDLSNNYISSGTLKTGETVGSMVYSDSVMTNGGHLIMNKQVGFDSSNKGRGGNNLESQNVMTYESIDGSHLIADEMLVATAAGNYSVSDEGISCVFGGSGSSRIPAFYSTITAKSALINVNSARVSTSAKARLASARERTPAAVSYQIDLIRNPGSTVEYAVGTVQTEFTVSALESRGTSSEDWNKTASENTMQDKTQVSGGIIRFSKSFDYKSGIEP
jgi:hypothetical protein